jgi:hypothetical protein
VAATPHVVEHLECQWCGAEWAKKGERFDVRTHAMHETRCPESPHYTPPEKGSKAWNPMPWPHDTVGRTAVPNETSITYVGGPYHGQRRGWVGYLVDGREILTEPPLVHLGPVTPDSKGRMCSKYMGHYELSITEGCPVYRWVDTLTPKKRLSQPPQFTTTWPDLADHLEEQAHERDGTSDGLDRRLLDSVEESDEE